MGPTWPFLLMYGSHDMRHAGFSQVEQIPPPNVKDPNFILGQTYVSSNESS